MDRGIPQLFGNLCKVQMSCPYHFFCPIDFQQCKIFDDSHTAPFFKYLLKLGPSYQIVPTDLVDGNRGVDPNRKVVGHAAVYLGVAFALGRL